MKQIDDEITTEKLLYFSSKVCNICIDKIQIESLIYYDSEDFFHSEYKEPQSFIFQDLILNTDEKTINLILKNLESAIASNCGNTVNVKSVSVSDEWGYSNNINNDERAVTKRYTECKIRPNNESEFKLMWLKIFIEDLEKVVEAIQYIVTPKPVRINQEIISAEPCDTVSKYNSEFYVLAFLFDCQLKGERYPTGKKAKLEKIGKERTKGVISGNTFYKKFNTIMELRSFDIHKEDCLIELCGENWREIILSMSEFPEQLDEYLHQKHL